MENNTFFFLTIIALFVSSFMYGVIGSDLLLRITLLIAGFHLGVLAILIKIGEK